jgi:hypothetical protein
METLYSSETCVDFQQMETLYSSETSVDFQRTARLYVHNHSCENLKSCENCIIFFDAFIQVWLL